MRIFCCSNCAPCQGVIFKSYSFNPPCGFFVVRTPTPALGGGRWWWFQSAMRIFCCSNAAFISLKLGSSEFQSAMRIFCCSNVVVNGERVSWVNVSIRHADFLLFEPVATEILRRCSDQFQSAMRIFCCSNFWTSFGLPPTGRVSIRHADFLLFERRAAYVAALEARGFNPPCGFFVVRTAPHAAGTGCGTGFQSAMRIFCCSNFLTPLAYLALLFLFQSAMRIFCCSNSPARRARGALPTVSIRHADFLLFEPVDGVLPQPDPSSFNPPCGFFVVRTRPRTLG